MADGCPADPAGAEPTRVFHGPTQSLAPGTKCSGARNLGYEQRHGATDDMDFQLMAQISHCRPQ